ncbi:MAG: ROK family transcriptional regulator [Rectinemataceae bacterium]
MGKSRETGWVTTERILRKIRQSPHTSRIALAQELGLDKSTITNQVNALIERGIVAEVAEGDASSKGGRRPIHLCIEPAYGLIIGIELQVEAWVALLVDLSGEVLAELRGNDSIKVADFSETVLGIIKKCRAAFLAPDGPAGPHGGPLLGIGIGMGGLIDPVLGTINYSIPLAINSPVDFASQVASRLDVPCFIDNDANCCAWGELSFTKGDNLNDFLFVLVEYRTDKLSVGQAGGLGVGFGIALGGKVYSGQHGNAGEFRSAFCEGAGKLQFSLSREKLSKLHGDRDAHAKTMDELARNVAMLVNTMDFNHVFIGGSTDILGADFPLLLRRRLEESWMYPFPKDVVIRMVEIGDAIVSYGAAGMAYERLLSEKTILGPSIP